MGRGRMIVELGNKKNRSHVTTRGSQKSKLGGTAGLVGVADLQIAMLAHACLHIDV